MPKGNKLEPRLNRIGSLSQPQGGHDPHWEIRLPGRGDGAGDRKAGPAESQFIQEIL